MAHTSFRLIHCVLKRHGVFFRTFGLNLTSAFYSKNELARLCTDKCFSLFWTLGARKRLYVSCFRLCPFKSEYRGKGRYFCWRFEDELKIWVWIVVRATFHFMLWFPVRWLRKISPTRSEQLRQRDRESTRVWGVNKRKNIQ